jgi:hypothetical protein
MDQPHIAKQRSENFEIIHPMLHNIQYTIFIKYNINNKYDNNIKYI